jgi:hypothetical protein
VCAYLIIELGETDAGALDLFNAGREGAEAALRAQRAVGVVNGQPRRRQIKENGVDALLEEGEACRADVTVAHRRDLGEAVALDVDARLVHAVEVELERVQMPVWRHGARERVRQRGRSSAGLEHDAAGADAQMIQHQGDVQLEGEGEKRGRA